ncbi:ArsR/SmtB family transcription factor [Terasakiella sp.]|uniref:ArsR/SmtB family transcription factor n=1 Tax=Terasakiella sp. TaxID=2034861 RepID=UPI003AA8B1F5
MDQTIAVKRLGELGHDTRMSVFRLLVKAGKKGMVVGDIQRHLDVSAPNLSHHIHRLIGVGLIRQKRDGRSLYCYAELDALREIMNFLEAECCTL